MPEVTVTVTSAMAKPLSWMLPASRNVPLGSTNRWAVALRPSKRAETTSLPAVFP